MLNLLIKDFKLMFARGNKLTDRVISLLFVVLFVGCFVALEVFLFQSIIDKISGISGAIEAFLSVFLFVIMILMTVSDVFSAKKLFFNPKDIEMLSNRPVSNGQVVASKLILLFLTHYVSAFVFEYPIFVAYGINAGMSAIYYFSCVFYPAISFIFEGGIALLFVYPVYLAACYLKNKPLVKLIMAAVLMSVLAYAYSFVLEVFVNLVANNGMAALFTSENIAKLSFFSKSAVPISFLIDIFINKNSVALVYYLLLATIVMAAGVTLTVISYNYVRNVSFSSVTNKKERKVKVTSVIKALIKKEFSLILKDSDYIFSFTGLLIVQPFLLCMVLRAINSVLNSGTMLYYTNFIPGFVQFIDAFFVIIFTTTIASGANKYISMESLTIKNMKTMPVSVYEQLGIKVVIPFAMSFASLFVTVLVLVISGTLSVLTALFCFLLATFALVFYDVISLYEELKIRHARPRSSFESSAISYIAPIAFILWSIISSYYGINYVICFVLGVAVFSVSAAIAVLAVWSCSAKLFLELEAVN